MSNEMVSERQAPVGPAAASTNPNALPTRLIAGVSVPDGPLITAAIEYARRLSEPYLFNHAMRSWLFAELIGRAKGIDYDREVVAVGTILHDIGLTPGVSGLNRFEVNGADAALSFIRGRGLSDRRAQLVWDLVALNSTPSLALHKERAVAAGQFRDRAQIRAPALQDVDISRGPHQTVALGDNESAETMKFRWARQLCVEVPKKRTPRLREWVRGHWRARRR